MMHERHLYFCDALETEDNRGSSPVSVFVEDPAHPPASDSHEHRLALLRYLDGSLIETEMHLDAFSFWRWSRSQWQKREREI